MYKKRSGTTAVHGQFYESKLLSLILFRALNDDFIEEFYLASNMEDIGAFDDICIKMKIKGGNRPLIVFIQAKHRENTDKILTLNSKNDLVKYFNSYLTIKQKFDPNSNDKIFNEEFDNTECVFIIYTNERGDLNNKLFLSYSANHLNGLIATGKVGTRPLYTDEEVQFLSKINTATTLAKQFVKLLYSKNNQIMTDEYILLYHVVLAQNVVLISEIKEQYATCTFRPEFFTNTDEFLAMFRDVFYREVLKVQKVKKVHKTNLHEFLSAPNENTLSHVIGRVVVYKNGKLELTVSMPPFIKEKLDQINVSPTTVNEAIKLGAMNILKDSSFVVPSAFGNSDIKLRGKPDDIEKRLNYLTMSIVNMIEMTKPSNIIVIDESVNEGILRLNGGLGSAVGNLLVYDVETNFFKFNDNISELKNNARCLLQKLESEIYNLHEYRFDVKEKLFPKLSLDGTDEAAARDFLSKLAFYTQQGDHNYVEWITKQEIEHHQDRHRLMYPSNIEITPDAIFLKYHDLVQKWWMPPKDVSAVPYLTKSNDIYQQAINNIINSSQANGEVVTLNEIVTTGRNSQSNTNNEPTETHGGLHFMPVWNFWQVPKNRLQKVIYFTFLFLYLFIIVYALSLIIVL